MSGRGSTPRRARPPTAGSNTAIALPPSGLPARWRRRNPSAAVPPRITPALPLLVAPFAGSIRVLGNAGRSWQLTIAATDQLRAGASVINVGNISWTSSRANQGWLAGGTLAVAAPQTMAAGTGNTVNSRSNIGFLLQNLWTYDPGSYTTSATLTLSAP